MPGVTAHLRLSRDDKSPTGSAPRIDTRKKTFLEFTRPTSRPSRTSLTFLNSHEGCSMAQAHVEAGKYWVYSEAEKLDGDLLKRNLN